MTWSQWISLPQSWLALAMLVVALFAFAANVVSARSSRRSSLAGTLSASTAVKALGINEATADAANLELVVDISRATFLRSGDTTDFTFDVEITNPSTRSNSVIRLPLTIIFEDGSEGSFDPQPIPGESKSGGIAVPLEIPASSQRIGPVTYKCSESFLQGRLVRRFIIEAIDPLGRKTGKPTISVSRDDGK